MQANFEYLMIDVSKVHEVLPERLKHQAIQEILCQIFDYFGEVSFNSVIPFYFKVQPERIFDWPPYKTGEDEHHFKYAACKAAAYVLAVLKSMDLSRFVDEKNQLSLYVYEYRPNGTLVLKKFNS